MFLGSALSALLLSAPAALASVRVLFQNDLSANAATSTPALFLSESISGSQASSACQVYSESLLGNVTSDIQDQLNYLVFRGQLSNSSRLHIAGSGSGLRYKRQQSGCRAYTIGSQNVTDVSCDESFPTLCTNTPNAYSADNFTPAQGSQVTVSGSSGSFTGFRDARSFRFLGIPFAAAPVGDLRFAAAQAYNGTYDNFDATSYGDSCIQRPSPFGITNSSISSSEDCLNLNVYTPVIPTKSSGNVSLPVEFWIYGGAFEEGTIQLPEYDGGNVASRGDVVVVTVNYRLGPLGFLAGPNLNGSQGITDQIQALRWVQEHISTFGGNPDHVTIAGESAGGQSVIALMSSTSAKGLFAAAISQSTPWLPFPTREVYSSSIYPAVLNGTGCSSAANETAQLACLRQADASSFISNTTTNLALAAAVAGYRQYAQLPITTSAVEPFLPVIGTGVVDGLFVDLIRDGNLPSAGKPLLIGNVQDEGTLFVFSTPGLTEPIPFNVTVLAGLIFQSFDNATANAVISNPTAFMPNLSDPDAVRNAAAQLTTLESWQCPLQQILTTAYEQNTFSGLYSYRMDQGVPQNSELPAACTPDNISGVDQTCHSEDVPLVFGNLNVRQYNGTQPPEYIQYVVDVWTSFIRTYDPQPNSDYLTARGRSYENTLQLAQADPFAAFTPNGTNALQLIDLPPSGSPLVFQQQCQILQNATFYYDNVPQSVTTESRVKF